MSHQETDMVYDHIVKSNGIFYPAGVEVPDFVEPLPFSDLDEVEPLTFEDEVDASAKENQATSTGKRGRPKKTD